MRAMSEIKQITTPNGIPGYAGHLGVSRAFRSVDCVPSANSIFDFRCAIKSLVKALMTERRVFRIENPSNYPRSCKLQGV